MYDLRGVLILTAGNLVWVCVCVCVWTLSEGAEERGINELDWVFRELIGAEQDQSTVKVLNRQV